MEKQTEKFYIKIIKDYDTLQKYNSTFEEFHLYNEEFFNDCDIVNIGSRTLEHLQLAIKQLKIFYCIQIENKYHIPM